jgi:hypothetical protein
MSLHQETVNMAKIDGTSLNTFICLAVAEKIARIEAFATSVARSPMGQTNEYVRPQK